MLFKASEYSDVGKYIAFTGIAFDFVVERIGFRDLMP